MKTLVESIVNELKITKASTGDKLNKKTKFGELKVGDIFYVVGGFGNNVISEYTVEKITPISHFTREKYTSTYPDELKKIEVDCELYGVTNKGRLDFSFFVNKEDYWEILPSTSGYLLVATTVTALKDALECPAVDIQPSNKKKYL